MYSTPSLSLLSGPCKLRVLEPIRFLFIGEIELFNHLLRIIRIISCFLRPNN